VFHQRLQPHGGNVFRQTDVLLEFAEAANPQDASRMISSDHQSPSESSDRAIGQWNFAGSQNFTNNLNPICTIRRCVASQLC
jgi:hypothetical protein